MKEQRLTEKTNDGRYKLISEVVIPNYLEKTKRAIDKLGELEDILEEFNLSILDFKQTCNLGLIVDSKNNIVIRKIFGSCNVKNTITNKRTTLELSIGDGYQPIIKSDNKFFILNWKDIIKLAMLKGILTNEVQDEKQ